MELEEIIIIEIIIGPITEIEQEADGTIIGQVIGVTITRITIDEVILDPITDHNAQWTSRKRSQSRK